jgi:hypothetical protein
MDTAEHLAARFLLRQGRTFEAAVEKFSPYESVKEPFPEAREAAAGLVDYVLKERKNSPKKRKLFLYVNNRLEGSALETIYATLMKISLCPQDLPTPPAPAPPATDNPQPGLPL